MASSESGALTLDFPTAKVKSDLPRVFSTDAPIGSRTRPVVSLRRFPITACRTQPPLRGRSLRGRVLA